MLIASCDFSLRMRSDALSWSIRRRDRARSEKERGCGYRLYSATAFLQAHIIIWAAQGCGSSGRAQAGCVANHVTDESQPTRNSCRRGFWHSMRLARARIFCWFCVRCQSCLCLSVVSFSRASTRAFHPRHHLHLHRQATLSLNVTIAQLQRHLRNHGLQSHPYPYTGILQSAALALDRHG